MILSDSAIRSAIAHGELNIEPLVEENIQPASIDIRLGPGLFVSKATGVLLDPQQSADSYFLPAFFNEHFGAYVLNPGEFAIGTTLEVVTIGTRHIAQLCGKSSLARLGLAIHMTAGYVDPGFCGQITLELANVSQNALVLRPGMKIGQFTFQRVEGHIQRPYGHKDLNSKYQDQAGATHSKYHENKRV